jgi:hypothetical protein
MHSEVDPIRNICGIHRLNPEPSRSPIVTPRFSAGLINPNDPVNSVDFGQTTVNLSHHLENITNDP